MRVEYHPQTATELNRAVAHYNDLRPGLGDELRLEVYGAIDRILANPYQFAVVERDASEEVVRVLAIRHHRRHPRLGLGRR